MKKSRFACRRSSFLVWSSLLAAAAVSIVSVRAQPVASPDHKFWIPNGTINTVLAVSNTVYLGGEFSYLGPRTGPAALFDMASGLPLGSPPEMDGTVRAVIPDGSGGWFIGGDFTVLGSEAIYHVARLKSDLSLDTTWDAQLNGAAVNALAQVGDVVYVGGQFTRVAGQTVSGLAGVSMSNGSLVWNARLSGGSVNALSVVDGLLYVGGNFSSLGGSNRQNIAAITLTNGLASGWNPGADSTVLALAVSGNTVFIGGQFNNAGGKPRSRLAAIDAATGAALTTFNPNPNGVVRALAVDGSTVYVGGDFTTISISSRRGFAALDAGNGAATSLDFQLESASTLNLVRSILLDGSSLYVGGQFTGALGEDHVMLAGWDLAASQVLPTPLATEVNGSSGAAYGANALARQNGRMLTAGDFLSFGGVGRTRAAALSAETGEPLPWAPVFDGPVLALASGSQGIYVGGAFTNVNRTNLARSLALVDRLDGSVLPFTFRGTNGTAAVSVRSLAVQGDKVYVGGAFTVIGSLARRFTGVLDASTGDPYPPFDAKLGGGTAVTSVLLAGTNLYLAGDFTTVNSISMLRLAAVSPVTGAAVFWNPKPSPNQAVNELAANEEALFVGGQFSTMSGIALRGFGAYRLSDNSLLPIDAALPSSGIVNSLAATPATIYVGGTFTSIGGENRHDLGALSTANGGAYDWNPAPDAGPGVLAVDENFLYLGGAFRIAGPDSDKAPFFLAFARGPRTAITLKAGNVQVASNSGDRLEAVLQAASSLANPVWTNLSTNSAGRPFTNSLPITGAQSYFRTIAR